MSKSYGSAGDVFSVKSQADLGLHDIFIDASGLAHIQLGHRSLSNITQFGLKHAVERPSRVYLSAEMPTRYLFHSDEVLSKGGKPMMVVVQRIEGRGRIITATPHPRPSGQSVWESAGSLYSTHDEDSDILYISKGAASDSYVTHEEPRIWFNATDEADEAYGVTIFDIVGFWADRKDELAQKIAEFLQVMKPEIMSRINLALKA